MSLHSHPATASSRYRVPALGALALALGPLTLGLGTAATPVPARAETTIRTSAPDTAGCPHSLVPPPPRTTSEQLAPNVLAPTPLPPTPTAECGVKIPAGFQLDPAVLGSAWMITDLDSGDIIAMKDPHGRYRPASIIKALLAQVAIRELPLDRVIIASAADAAVEGSAVGVGPDGAYTVEQLLEGLILASGNDTAHALAGALGGDEVALRKVNALAKELGTTDTRAASYHGLDAPGMSTSAYDMSLIYQAAFHNPTFARIARTPHVDFPGYPDHPGYEVWNDNGLFMNDPDGIGGKTGYTDDAHHTFVGALDRQGRRLMAVVLDTTVEHGYRSWQQAQMLLHAAYQLPPGTKVGNLSPLGARPTTTSTSTSTSTTTNTQAATTTTPRPDRDRTTDKATDKPADKSWVGWVVVPLIALSAISGAVFSLLPRRRNGRATRAKRFRL